MCVEAGSQPSVLFLRSHLPWLSKSGLLTRTWGLQIQPGWLANSSRNPHISASPVEGWQIHIITPNFLHDAWDWTQVVILSWSSTLSTEPFPQPLWELSLTTMALSQEAKDCKCLHSPVPCGSAQTGNFQTLPQAVFFSLTTSSKCFMPRNLWG